MADLITFIQFIWPLIAGFIGALAWSKFFYKKERRLFENIRRPIVVVGTADKPMQHEYTLLMRVGFFTVEPPSSDERVADLMNGKRLVVIGYTPGSKVFKDAFNAAKQREIPVIVYAGPTRINEDDMKLLQSYSHHSMCNTPLRLISDAFSVMSTYPEDLK